MPAPRIELLIVDPQVEFMDLPGSQLPVPGATRDMARLAAFIDRCGERLAGIHVTLDSHHPLHIAHPMMWVDREGAAPTPYTTISTGDVAAGVWRPSPRLSREDQAWCLSYVERLAEGGRYPLVVWPPHCLIGSAGHAVEAGLHRSLCAWATRAFAQVKYHAKGSNHRTEHYSALAAEVPDPAEPATAPNRRLLELQAADVLLVAGEARSHCVANTVRDMATAFDPGNIGKLHLLADCTSDVLGFEQLGRDFVAELAGQGMRLVDSVEF
jgi:nicotinamidase-related amidase